MKFFKFLFFALLAIFPFGQLGRIPLGEGEIVLQLNDLIIGFLIGAWIFWHLVKGERFINPNLGKYIFLFFIIGLTSSLLNLPRWAFRLSGSLYFVRWVSYAGLYLLTYELILKKEISSGRIFRSLVLVGIVVAGLGIFQYFLYPDLRNLYYLGWDPHYFRVFSTFFDPTFTGAILVLTLLPLVIIFLAGKYKDRLTKWWIIASGVTVYIALALTYSRASYLAFLVGMGVIAYLRRSPKLFLITSVIFILTLVVLPKREDRIGSNLAREDTITARIINWKQSLVIIKDHPLIGVGFNNYLQAQKQYGFTVDKGIVSHAGAGADSSLLFAWATTGIFGFFGFLWLGWKMAKLALRSWWDNKSIYGLALFSSLAALFAHSLFSNSLFYPWIMEWIWILAAMVSVDRVKPRYGE